ncbi:hypothetical protein SHIRM173S_00056 [Streptomyces hirsutus]
MEQFLAALEVTARRDAETGVLVRALSGDG